MHTKAPLRLHRNVISGHSHRAQLMLSLLSLEHTLIDVDLRRAEHKSPAFLRLNPFGQVPVLEDGEVVIADSNAILVYLAGRYDEARRYLPEDLVAQARIQRWLSVAAGQLAFGPAALRVAKLFKLPIDVARATQLSESLLSVLNGELAQGPFLVGREATIADVAMYTYTKVAPEGGLSLAPYGQINAWLARIEALPGFVPMPSAS